MAEITIRVKPNAVLRKAMADRAMIEGPIRVMLLKIALTVEGRAKVLAPVDTGRLRSSITHRVAELHALVVAPVFYAPHVEFGTRPHFPPPGALAVWARRHGFASPYPVALAIARRGTRAQPFMRPAAEATKKEIPGFVREAAAAIRRRWHSG